MRALIHLVARHRAEARFDAALRAEVERMRAASLGVRSVHGMLRLDDDIFGPCAPFRGTLELVASEGEAARLAALAAGVAGRFGDLIHADLSTALVGSDHVFVEPQRTPVRYQYLMRRNADFGHGDYLERYARIHSQFGVKTPGIHGYVQLHVDLDASRSLAAQAGVGVWEVDSVSDLYLESLEAFLAAIGALENDGGAREDEEIFVDKQRSFDFASRVDWQA